MALVMAELTDGVIVQDEEDLQLVTIPFDPWCCADPWRRITVEGSIGTVPEIAGFFSPPALLLRWEGGTDIAATFGLVWFDGDAYPTSVGGAWSDPATGVSDWGVVFGASTPEGSNSPLGKPGDPYRMTLEWNASGGDPTPVISFYVNDALSASACIANIDACFASYGYPSVPNPAAVGAGLGVWGPSSGPGLSGPLYDVTSLEVACCPARDLPTFAVEWQDLP